ncbi:MAG: hypothetical protein Q8N55_03145, partial [bacterium]|nr:hypothetical protein [bacterium]
MLKNPKVLIINPLGRCASELPSLNIHLLEAYLNKKGLNARSYDLSARLWNNLNTDKEFFKQIYDQFYKKVRTRNGNYLRKILFLFYLNKKFTHIINNFEKKEAVNNELLYFYYLFTRIPLVFYKGSNDSLSSVVLKKLLPLGMLKDSNLFQDLVSPPLDTIGKELKKRLTGVNVVCISATYDQQLGPMFSLARFIKEYKPKTRIIIGGRAITQYADHNKINHQHFKLVDYVIIDEGEESLFKLITSMDNKKRLKDVPNLCYMLDDFTIRNRPAFVKNLDSLPPPDYSSFFSDRNIFNKPELLPYEIGRGCYWKNCSFCQTYRTESQYREKSA